LHPTVLFRKNVGRGHWKAGGEPHAWSSGSNVAVSSIITSIFDGLENSGISEFVSVRMLCSEERLESPDEHERMLNAPETCRDIDSDEGIESGCVGEERCNSGAGRNKCKDLTKSSHPGPYK